MEMEMKRIVGLIVAVVVVIVLVALVVGSFEEIPEGHKGVIVNSPGGPSTQEINEGWNFDLEFLVADVVEVEWRTQKMSFVGADSADDDVGSIIVSSKDNIKVYMDFSIIYHIEEDKVAELIIDNGMDYRSRIINPIARSEPRNVGAMYNAIDIRGELRVEVEAAIATQITIALAEKYIIVETFTLQDVRLPASLEKAIEDKKVAEQNVLTQQYNLAAEQYVANKTIVQMEAEAAAILINATAQRNATIVRSEGLAEAISIVMAHLNSTYENQTSDYLQWVYMQALTDPNTSITYVILPSDGGVPILLDVE